MLLTIALVIRIIKRTTTTTTSTTTTTTTYTTTTTNNNTNNNNHNKDTTTTTTTATTNTDNNNNSLLTGQPHPLRVRGVGLVELCREPRAELRGRLRPSSGLHRAAPAQGDLGPRPVGAGALLPDRVGPPRGGGL